MSPRQCSRTASLNLSSRYLRTKNLESVTQLVELLLPRLTSWGTEDHLCIELPGLGDVPGLLDVGIDQGIIVLEVGTESLCLQGGPGDVLGHAVGVDGPYGEPISVDRELLLHTLHDSRVDKEEDLVRVCE